MSKKQTITIYAMSEKQKEGFGIPIYFVTDVEAKKQITLLYDADNANMVNTHNEKLALYKLGTYNFVTGAISSFKKPIMVMDLKVLTPKSKKSKKKVSHNENT